MAEIFGTPMILEVGERSLKHVQCEFYSRCLAAAERAAPNNYWSCEGCCFCPSEPFVARNGKKPMRSPDKENDSLCQKVIWSLRSYPAQRRKGRRSSKQSAPKEKRIYERITSDLLIKVRKALGLRQSDLASQVGAKNGSVVSDWETGRHAVGAKYRTAVAGLIREALGPDVFDRASGGR